MVVAKFGGSSLADAAQFQKVKNIVFADSRRMLIIPSAPGRRFDKDEKVTDLLYLCHSQQASGMPFQKTFEEIQKRYSDIAKQLHLSLELEPFFQEIQQQMEEGASADYFASRGEFLNGVLLANYLGFEFLDAAEVIFFNEQGVFEAEKTNYVLKQRLDKIEKAVIPGFYGSNPDGSIRVFSRGGSDITGAIVARAAQAELYENWTDVSGFLMADPRIVTDPRPISHITYHEMHELCCAGATVLHEDCVFPVSSAGIPTNIRNTNLPQHPGTMITCSALQREDFAIFAGVSGKKGFSLLVIEKENPDHTWSFVQEVLRVAKKYGIKFQYLPSGAHCVCLLVEAKQFFEKQQDFEREITKSNVPFSMTVQPNIAGIVLVGYGIIHNRLAVNRIYTALQRHNIDVAMINQGSGELSTWVGVSENEMEEAICAIYEEFL
ncbi:aspartate kinase [Anaerotignum sp.]|uniref:aspartate kinase n=1 Tax=Anaerotignum sp. TaxID=2039241 RepID=UPI00289CAE22|nr:aspartate kinase [Anaerotignum sp.]